MKQSKFVLFSAFIVLFTILSSCTKYDKPGELNEAGVALTFDDYNIDNWYKYLPVLDSMHIPVTLYISNYHTLTPEQKMKLKTMAAHGHEIGYHSTNHVDMAKFVAKYGCAKLESEEIMPDLELMRKDGFNPVTFAYPFGAHTQHSDAALLRTFKSLRCLNGSTNLAKSLTASTNETMLYGLGLDTQGVKKDEEYNRMLESAAANKTCLVFVGHMIEEGDTKLKVPLSRLKRIIKKAQELNLRFYTAREISAK